MWRVLRQQCRNNSRFRQVLVQHRRKESGRDLQAPAVRCGSKSFEDPPVNGGGSVQQRAHRVQGVRRQTLLLVLPLRATLEGRPPDIERQHARKAPGRNQTRSKRSEPLHVGWQREGPWQREGQREGQSEGRHQEGRRRQHQERRRQHQDGRWRWSQARPRPQSRLRRRWRGWQRRRRRGWQRSRRRGWQRSRRRGERWCQQQRVESCQWSPDRPRPRWAPWWRSRPRQWPSAVRPRRRLLFVVVDVGGGAWWSWSRAWSRAWKRSGRRKVSCVTARREYRNGQ